MPKQKQKTKEKQKQKNHMVNIKSKNIRTDEST